ncbi:MAG: hypothetical protein ABSB33_02300 [Tepidisphaeraceae bacterium]|jgi:hypothetical protein
MMSKNEHARRRSAKDPNVYPKGWNRERVHDVIKYYDRLKDQPVLDRPRVAKADELVWMEIPEGLVPKVQKLIAASRKSA